MKEKIILHVTKLLQQQKRWKRWQKAVTAMAAVVVFCTVYALILPAVTMGAKTFCGMEEHVHTDECYLLRRIGASTPSDAERWDIDDKLGTPSNAELEDRLEELREFYLTEGGKGTASNADRATASDAMEYEWDENDKYKYDTSLIGDDSFLLDDYLPYTEGMEYDEENYELIRICEMEEHTHSLICYSDPEADLEDETIWTQTIPELSGNIPEDLIRVAQSQMNYRESEKNYQVEGVDVIKGYSRYGQWYGEPYGDWGTMFASFCMNYAGVENAPVTADFDGLMESMKGGVPELYREKDYIPKPGDLVFAAGAAGQPGRVGVITDVELDDEGNVSKFTAIEGDYENQVAARTHRGGEEDIRGFAALSKFGPDEEIVIITLTAETENTIVTATFEKSTLPENVKMEAEEISKDDPQVVEMREKLAEQGKSQGKVLTAMVPMNITFLDEEGKTVEPQGPVQYSVEFKTPVKNVDESLAEDETEKDGGSDSEDQVSAKTEAAQPKDEGTPETLEVSRAQISAKERVIVATAVSGADQPEDEEKDASAGDEADTDGQKDEKGDGTSWQLFSQTPDGELEDHSGDEKTELKSENGALVGASFEFGGAQEENAEQEAAAEKPAGSRLYMVALRGARTGDPDVSTFAELKDKLKDGLSAKLVNDITVADGIEGLEAGEAAIVIDGSNKNAVLDLNGHTLTMSKSGMHLIKVTGGANLTIEDSSDSKNQPERLNSTPVELENLWNFRGTAGGTLKKDDAQVGILAKKEEDGWVFSSTEIIGIDRVDNKGTGGTTEGLVEYLIPKKGMITSPADNASSEADEGGAILIQGGTMTLASGAIAECANRAIVIKPGTTKNTLNLNGGYLYGNTATTMCNHGGGAVFVSNESSEQKTEIILSGSYIIGNKTIGVPAVKDENGKETTPAVAGVGGAFALEKNSSLNMTGGYIAGNSATNDGGAIYLHHNATATFTDGYVTNNHSIGGQGGGLAASGTSVVRLQDDCHFTGNVSERGGAIITRGNSCKLFMSGGFVTRNLAVSGEGGGITVEHGSASFTGGHITNNRTDTPKDWGGGGVFIADGAEAYVENVLVTQNKAGGFGGGVTGCPTSRVYVGEKNSMAIYDNKAGKEGETENKDFDLDAHIAGAHGSGKDQDVKFAFKNDKFMKGGYQDYFCALTCSVSHLMLGGYSAGWEGTCNYYPIKDPTTTLETATCMGLTAHPTEPGKTAAQNAATLFVNGNSSWTHAGGILCNGYMIAGNVESVNVPDRIEIEGKKILVGENGPTDPLAEGAFTFEILDAKGVSLGIFKNETSKFNNTTNQNEADIYFNAMLPANQEGMIIYYVREINQKTPGILSDTTVYRINIQVGKQVTEMKKPGTDETIEKTIYKINAVDLYRRSDNNLQDTNGWTWVVSPQWTQNNDEQGHDTLVLSCSENNELAFVNRKTEGSTNVKVTKKWTDGDEQHLTDGVRVHLTVNGTSTTEKSVTLNTGNNWSHEWNELPVADDNGNKIYYSVSEDTIEGYEGKITVTNGSKGEDSSALKLSPAKSLEPGKKYIIVGKDNTKALRITGAHMDMFFNADDTVSIDISDGTLSSSCSLFSVQMHDNRSVLYLDGTTRTLLIENYKSGNENLRPERCATKLKATGLVGSGFEVDEQSHLIGNFYNNNGQHELNTKYIVVYDSEKDCFDAVKYQQGSVSDNAVLVYQADVVSKRWTYVTEITGDNALSLTNTMDYIIVSPDGKQALSMSHNDRFFETQDTKTVEWKKDGTLIDLSGISVFKKDTAGYLSGRVAGEGEGHGDAWLRIQEKEDKTKYFKSTRGSEWACRFQIKGGKLVGNLCDTDTEYLVIYDNGIFNAVTYNGNEDNPRAVKVYGCGKNTYSDFTITNTPHKDLRYQLQITKVDATDTKVGLVGACFEVYAADENGNLTDNPLKFARIDKNTNTNTDRNTGYYVYNDPENSSLDSENPSLTTSLVTVEQGALIISDLPQGTYWLKETSAPGGYSTVDDLKIQIMPGTDEIKLLDGTKGEITDIDGTTISITIKDPKYILPETGGDGKNWYALGGMLFMMAGGLVYGYSSRCRRERRFR